MGIKYYELTDMKGQVAAYVEVTGSNPELIQKIGKESKLQEIDEKKFASKLLEVLANENIVINQ